VYFLTILTPITQFTDLPVEALSQFYGKTPSICYAGETKSTTTTIVSNFSPH